VGDLARSATGVVGLALLAGTVAVIDVLDATVTLFKEKFRSGFCGSLI